jgi:streptogramin lyase
MERFPHRRDDPRSRAARRGRTRREQRRRRPELEGLEVRALLTTITEYPILTSDPGANGTAPGGVGYGIASGGGYLWVAETGSGQIARIDPNNPGAAPLQIAARTGALPYDLVVDPQGRVWFTDEGLGAVGVYNPGTQTVTEYDLPDQSGPGAKHDVNSVPVGITVGPDGNIWFTQQRDNLLGMINPNTAPEPGGELPISRKVVTVYSAGTSPSELVSAGGDLWFTESDLQTIGEFNPSSPLAGSTPTTLQQTAGMSGLGIAVGSDGNLLIGLESPGGTYGAVVMVILNDPTMQTIYRDNSSPLGVSYVTAGSDGLIWFLEMSGKNAPGGNAPGGNIGMIDPSSSSPIPQVQAIKDLSSPSISYSQPAQLVEGPDGNIWFTDPHNQAVGVVLSTTPSPVVRSTTPSPIAVIISAQLNSYSAKHNQKGKPIGKPDAQVTVSYSGAVNTSAIDNPGIYMVEWETLKKVRTRAQDGKRFRTVAARVPVFTPVPATFQPVGSSGNTVVLRTTVPFKKFAKGGQVVVTYPGATPVDAVVALGDSTTIKIPAAG